MVGTPEPTHTTPQKQETPERETELTHAAQEEENEEGEWYTVKHKRNPASSLCSDGSPTPLNTFKNLTKVDEVDAKRAQFEGLSKSQLKKRKKAMGKPLNFSP